MRPGPRACPVREVRAVGRELTSHPASAPHGETVRSNARSADRPVAGSSAAFSREDSGTAGK